MHTKAELTKLRSAIAGAHRTLEAGKRTMYAVEAKAAEARRDVEELERRLAEARARYREAYDTSPPENRPGWQKGQIIRNHRNTPGGRAAHATTQADDGKDGW